MLIHGISSNNFKKIDNSLLKNLNLPVGTEVEWDDLNEKINDEQVYATLVNKFSLVIGVPNWFFLYLISLTGYIFNARENVRRGYNDKIHMAKIDQGRIGQGFHL